MDQDPLIRDISDTARWMAVYRARETERPDAVFRDPFARALAGERGEQIANAAVFGEENSWSFLARTYLFDRFVARQVKQGADLVVNLAAGLDTRPYRMEWPPTLRWVEVDLPDILDYKEEILGDAKPVCEVERVRLDLANPDARRGLFDRLGRSAQNVLVISEGLIIYLMPAEVGALAQDLAAPPTFHHWVVDIVSPGLLAMVKDRMGKAMQEAGAPFLFGPPEGPPFFEPYGWKPVDVRSMLKTAAKLERLPFMLRMFAMLPESSGAQGSQPWSGVCLLER
jgi:methyltransferase (TIGR00027 family)